MPKTFKDVITKLCLNYSVPYREELSIISTYKLFASITTTKHIHEVKVQHLKKFAAHLQELNTPKHGMNKRFQSIGRVLRYAHNVGMIRLNPMAIFKVPRVTQKNIVTITNGDILKIKSLQMQRPIIDKAIDVFLFQCYTGLSYGDAMQISATDLREYSGKLFIQKRRKKTSVEFITPVNTDALQILEKYGMKLPYISNFRYNLYLKEIAKIACIDKHLTTHVGRKTFGQLMLNNGVNIEDVSKMLGHSTTSMTERYYARVGVERIVRAVQQLSIAA